MNPNNIDHHLYAKPNTNQAMISSFPDQAAPSQPSNQLPHPNPPTHNSNQYSAPPQNYQDPFAPSIPGHQTHAAPQQNPHGYPHNHHHPQVNDFPQNNYQPLQQPGPQGPGPVIVHQTVHVIHHPPPQPQVQVNVIDYSHEDFRMLDGCYNWFKCWLMFFAAVGSIYSVFVFLWHWAWKWDQISAAFLPLIVYLVIFAKIQFDAIAELKLSKAKTAMTGFLFYIGYYWIIMAIVSASYNSDVGTLGLSLIGWYTFSIPAFLIGSIFVKRKLTRYETHKRGRKIVINAY